jgi:hypothetical protein
VKVPGTLAVASSWAALRTVPAGTAVGVAQVMVGVVWTTGGVELDPPLPHPGRKALKAKKRVNAREGL